MRARAYSTEFDVDGEAITGVVLDILPASSDSSGGGYRPVEPRDSEVMFVVVPARSVRHAVCRPPLRGDVTEDPVSCNGGGGSPAQIAMIVLSIVAALLILVIVTRLLVPAVAEHGMRGLVILTPAHQQTLAS